MKHRVVAFVSMREVEKMIRARIEWAEEQANGTHAWWWLSFATDTDSYTAMVFAPGFFSAIIQAHRHGINPGGGVRGMPFPSDEQAPPMKYQNRLFTIPETRAMLRDWKGTDNLQGWDKDDERQQSDSGGQPGGGPGPA